MSVITIFSASHCGDDDVVRGVAQVLKYQVATDAVLDLAAQKFGVPRDKLDRAMRGPASMFNAFTREKERHAVYIKAALAEVLKQDNVVCGGYAVQFAPRTVAHVLRVCLTATPEFRAAQAVKQGAAGSDREAARLIARDDTNASRWAQDLHDVGPWHKSLYDIRVPMHEKSVEQAVALIVENAQKPGVQTTEDSVAAMADFSLAAQVHLALVKEGHFDVDVVCADGVATVIINKHVMRLEPFEKELSAIARRVPGVQEARAKVGPDFYQADIYRRQSFDMPKKVLLVDDETEFVQTLSERLQMRDFGTAVAHDGESALEMVRGDEPEVMVLDLRMPGIDGLEVLRRIKQEQPDVQVIILTGHGTDQDRKAALDLGAFAYLEKPVDIEKLSQTMQAAYEEAQRRKHGPGGEAAD
jgi:CheY-like chemotaxis protein/cytidylate kinase